VEAKAKELELVKKALKFYSVNTGRKLLDKNHLMRVCKGIEKAGHGPPGFSASFCEDMAFLHLQLEVARLYDYKLRNDIGRQ
jgi:hypothetical protein